MDTFDIANLVYLILLLAAVGGYFFVEGRQSLGQVAKQASIWLIIILGLVAVYGLWGDISRQLMPRQSMVSEDTLEVPVGPDGHYHLVARVNGEPVEFLVDTGASNIVLTREDAVRVGLNPSELAFIGLAQTANGEVQTARVRLDSFTLGGFEDSRVVAYVNGGEMDGSLLGMTYLQRFSSVSFERGVLVLRR
ncbi:MAG: TIGR02281 family clan AA aspartic protease [Rhodobacterales bacterium]|nr:MAG: TIGR02281 family clan AA aspartic protease [Rhodobacterales bacterium]PIE12389.1 MAG: TIGR02281 family clan AA aspartic protease [Rhodobacterales bacterium]